MKTERAAITIKNLLESPKTEVALSPETLIQHFTDTLEEISANVAGLKGDYIDRKFARRVQSDYIGNENKMREIYYAITEIKNGYKRSIQKLNSVVG